MKKTNYSKSQIAAADKFLADYGLTLDHLDEPQKKIVANYAYMRKFLVLCLAAFVFSTTLFSAVAYLRYQKIHKKIEVISKKTVSDDATDLKTYGTYCFEQGVSVGIHAFCAFVMLLYIVLLLLILNSKRQVITAFLPLLKSPSPNENTAGN